MALKNLLWIVWAWKQVLLYGRIWHHERWLKRLKPKKDWSVNQKIILISSPSLRPLETFSVNSLLTVS